MSSETIENTLAVRFNTDNFLKHLPANAFFFSKDAYFYFEEETSSNTFLAGTKTLARIGRLTACGDHTQIMEQIIHRAIGIENGILNLSAKPDATPENYISYAREQIKNAPDGEKLIGPRHASLFTTKIVFSEISLPDNPAYSVLREVAENLSDHFRGAESVTLKPFAYEHDAAIYYYWRNIMSLHSIRLHNTVIFPKK